MIVRLISFLLFVLLYCGCNTTPSARQLPFVIDNSGLLTINQSIDLNNLYVYNHLQTGNRLGLLAIRDYKPGKSLHAFSVQYFNDHQLDYDSTHYNMLIVYCSGCHGVEILVGNGPGKLINDSVAKSIIDKVMIPFFKKERAYEGILNGSNAIIACLEKSPHNKSQ